MCASGLTQGWEHNRYPAWLEPALATECQAMSKVMARCEG